MAEAGKGIMDILVQPALGDLPVGKTGGQLKKAAGWDFVPKFVLI